MRRSGENMGKIGFIFPGQGSQRVGMGKGVYNRYPNARKILDDANDILDFDLKTLIFEGPEDELKKTENAQPAIFTVSIMYLELLKERGMEPDICAGHSLGEYSALVGSGCISFEDGLRLVRKRGLLMAKADPDRKGSMAAIIGLKLEEVESIVDEVNGVVVANVNSPIQVVVSGDRAGILRVMEMAKKRGARRAVELNVSGAFHSPLMGDAKSAMEEEIEKIKFSVPSCPIVPNVYAKVVTDIDIIKDALIEQMTGRVRWVESMKAMKDYGVESCVEVGEGNVLKGLMRYIDRDVKFLDVEL